MRLTTGAVFLAVAVAGVPGTAAAQGVCGGAVTAPSPGGYARYDVNLPSGTRAAARFAVVGTENREGTRNIWFETWVREGAKPAAIAQVLVPEFPYDPSAVADAALQGPTVDRPIHLNPTQLARVRRSLPKLVRAIVDGCNAASLVGTESVTVPAGTFRAQHFRNALRGSDIWVSSDVPFGILKMTDSHDKSGMVLTGMGTDAKSSFGGEDKGGGA